MMSPPPLPIFPEGCYGDELGDGWEEAVDQDLRSDAGSSEFGSDVYWQDDHDESYDESPRPQAGASDCEVQIQSLRDGTGGQLGEARQARWGVVCSEVASVLQGAMLGLLCDGDGVSSSSAAGMVPLSPMSPQQLGAHYEPQDRNTGLLPVLNCEIDQELAEAAAVSAAAAAAGAAAMAASAAARATVAATRKLAAEHTATKFGCEPPAVSPFGTLTPIEVTNSPTSASTRLATQPAIASEPFSRPVSSPNAAKLQKRPAAVPASPPSSSSAKEAAKAAAAGDRLPAAVRTSAVASRSPDAPSTPSRQHRLQKWVHRASVGSWYRRRLAVRSPSAALVWGCGASNCVFAASAQFSLPVAEDPPADANDERVDAMPEACVPSVETSTATGTGLPQGSFLTWLDEDVDQENGQLLEQALSVLGNGKARSPRKALQPVAVVPSASGSQAASSETLILPGAADDAEAPCDSSPTVAEPLASPVAATSAAPSKSSAADGEPQAAMATSSPSDGALHQSAPGPRGAHLCGWGLDDLLEALSVPPEHDANEGGAHEDTGQTGFSTESVLMAQLEAKQLIMQAVLQAVFVVQGMETAAAAAPKVNPSPQQEAVAMARSQALAPAPVEPGAPADPPTLGAPAKCQYDTGEAFLVSPLEAHRPPALQLDGVASSRREASVRPAALQHIGTVPLGSPGGRVSDLAAEVRRGTSDRPRTSPVIPQGSRLEENKSEEPLSPAIKVKPPPAETKKNPAPRPKASIRRLAVRASALKRSSAAPPRVSVGQAPKRTASSGPGGSAEEAGQEEVQPLDGGTGAATDPQLVEGSAVPLAAPEAEPTAWGSAGPNGAIMTATLSPQHFGLVGFGDGAFEVCWEVSEEQFQHLALIADSSTAGAAPIVQISEMPMQHDLGPALATAGGEPAEAPGTLVCEVSDDQFQALCSAGMLHNDIGSVIAVPEHPSETAAGNGSAGVHGHVLDTNCAWPYLGLHYGDPFNQTAMVPHRPSMMGDAGSPAAGGSSSRASSSPSRGPAAPPQPPAGDGQRRASSGAKGVGGKGRVARSVALPLQGKGPPHSHVSARAPASLAASLDPPGASQGRRGSSGTAGAAPNDHADSGATSARAPRVAAKRAGKGVARDAPQQQGSEAEAVKESKRSKASPRTTPSDQSPKQPGGSAERAAAPRGMYASSSQLSLSARHPPHAVPRESAVPPNLLYFPAGDILLKFPTPAATGRAFPGNPQGLGQHAGAQCAHGNSIGGARSSLGSGPSGSEDKVTPDASDVPASAPAGEAGERESALSDAGSVTSASVCGAAVDHAEAASSGYDQGEEEEVASGDDDIESPTGSFRSKDSPRSSDVLERDSPRLMPKHRIRHSFTAGNTDYESVTQDWRKKAKGLEIASGGGKEPKVRKLSSGSRSSLGHVAGRNTVKRTSSGVTAGASDCGSSDREPEQREPVTASREPLRERGAVSGAPLDRAERGISAKRGLRELRGRDRLLDRERSTDLERSPAGNGGNSAATGALPSIPQGRRGSMAMSNEKAQRSLSRHVRPPPRASQGTPKAPVGAPPARGGGGGAGTRRSVNLGCLPPGQAVAASRGGLVFEGSASPATSGGTHLPPLRPAMEEDCGPSSGAAPRRRRAMT